MNKPLDRLRHHVTGAIERGEKGAITEMTTKPATHTPGPWKLEKRVSDKHEQRVYGNVNGGPVALVEFMVPGGTILDRGNARLIAAAPELLEALEECVAALDNGASWITYRRRARAAIAKAKGEA